jgi:hypothetical protein
MMMSLLRDVIGDGKCLQAIATQLSEAVGKALDILSNPLTLGAIGLTAAYVSAGATLEATSAWKAATGVVSAAGLLVRGPTRIVGSLAKVDEKSTSAAVTAVSAVTNPAGLVSRDHVEWRQDEDRSCGRQCCFDLKGFERSFQGRGLTHPEMLEHFRIGFANTYLFRVCGALMPAYGTGPGRGCRGTESRDCGGYSGAGCAVAHGIARGSAGQVLIPRRSSRDRAGGERN